MTALRRALAWAVFAAALGHAVSLAVLFRASPPQFRICDARLLYRAGRAFASGCDVYSVTSLDSCVPAGDAVPLPYVRPFAYPPQTLPLLKAWAMLPPAAANASVVFANVLALALLCAAMPRPGGRRLRELFPEPALYCWAAVIANPSALVTMILGQTSLLVTAIVVLAWRLRREGGRPFVAGLLYALAAMKPQLVVCPLACELALGRERRRFVAGLLAGTALPFLALGSAALPLTLRWLRALPDYERYNPLGAGSEGVVALVHHAGLSLPVWGAALLALLALFALRRWKARPVELWEAGLVNAAFLCVRPYDLVSISTIAPFVPGKLREGGLGGRVVLAGGLLLLFYGNKLVPGEDILRSPLSLLAVAAVMLYEPRRAAGAR
jgi:hypothetical protein